MFTNAIAPTSAIPKRRVYDDPLAVYLDAAKQRIAAKSAPFDDWQLARGRMLDQVRAQVEAVTGLPTRYGVIAGRRWGVTMCECKPRSLWNIR